MKNSDEMRMLLDELRKLNLRELIDFPRCTLAKIRLIAKLIEQSSAVDVIRCKDCEYWRPSPFGDPVLGWCIICGHHRNPDYYCASADPKVTKRGESR